MSRHASRYNHRDTVEPAIVKALKSFAVPWYPYGPLDGWIFLVEWIPVELKTGKAPLTKGQREFIKLCQHDCRPYFVWRSVDDAIAAING